MKTRFFAVLLAMVMLFSLFTFVGCGEETGPNDNEDDTPKKETVQITNKPEGDLQVGDGFQLKMEYPDGLNFTKYEVDTTDQNVAKVKGDKVYFMGEGSATVTITNKSDAEDKDSFDVTVGKRDPMHIEIDMKSDYVEEYFVPYHYTTTNDGTMVDFDKNWSIDKETGILSCVPDEGTTVADIRTMYALYFKDRMFENFEIVFTYHNDEGPVGNGHSGHTGILAAKQDRTKSVYAGRKGDTAVEGEWIGEASNGSGVVWGTNVGTHSEAGNKTPSNYYRIEEWHLFKVKVYDTNLEIYIDDMNTPIMRKVVDTYPIEGYVAMMSNACSRVKYKNIGINYLNAQGEVIDYTKPGSVSIQNKEDFADVSIISSGIELDVGDAAYSFTSSNSEILSVDEEGMVQFLSEGTATITVRSLDDFELIDTLEVTVKPSDKRIEWTNAPEAETVNAGEVLIPTVTDENGTPINLQDITIELNDVVGNRSENARISGSGASQKILFVQKGTVVVNMYLTATPAIKVQKTLTIDDFVGGERVYTPFTAEDLKADFDYYYSGNISSGNRETTDYETVFTKVNTYNYFTLNEETQTICKNAVGNTNPANSIVSMLVKGKTAKNIEMTMNFNTQSAGNIMRLGFEFGVTDTTKVPGVAGDSFFISTGQREPGVDPTIVAWAITLGANIGSNMVREELVDFAKTEWHSMKIKAYGNKVEVYIDDLQTPLFVRENANLVEGAFGIIGMAGPGDFRNFSYAELNEDGTYKTAGQTQPDPEPSYVTEVDFTTEAFKEDFNYFITSNLTATGVKTATTASDVFEDNFSLNTATGTITKNPANADTNPDASMVTMLLKEQTAQYIELSMDFKANAQNVKVMGFEFGVSGEPKRPGVGGDMFYIFSGNINGTSGVGAVFSGKNIGAEKRVLLEDFDFVSWHTIKIRVLEKGVEFYLDGTLLYTYEYAENKGAAEGSFGLFGRAGSGEFRNFSYAELNADGTYKTQTEQA